jgi:hypothetical protein
LVAGTYGITLTGSIYAEIRPRRQVCGREHIAELGCPARDTFRAADYARAKPNAAGFDAPFVGQTVLRESDRTQVLHQVLKPRIARLILGRCRRMGQSSVLRCEVFSPGWLLAPGEDSGGADVE